MKKQNKEVTIKDILDLFLPKLWIVLVVGSIAAGAIAAHSIFIKKDTYTASTLVYVQKSNENSADDTMASDIEIAEEMVQIFEIAIYHADVVLNNIATEQLPEYNLSASAIRSMMAVRQYEETPYLEISVTHTNKDIAFHVAEKISDLSKDVLGDLGVKGLEVKVIDTPQPPKAPNSKHTARNAIIAFLAGAVATMAVIWIISIFDSVIRGRKKLEDNFNIPVLAVIPLHHVAQQKKALQNESLPDSVVSAEHNSKKDEEETK